MTPEQYYMRPDSIVPIIPEKCFKIHGELNPHEFSAFGFVIPHRTKKGKVALIDPGSHRDTKLLEENLMESCGVTFEAVEQILLSHGHTDHGGAVSAIQQESPQVRTYVHEFGKYALGHPDTTIRNDLTAAFYYHTTFPQTQISDIIQDGDTFEFAGYQATIYELPGHTNCSVGIHLDFEDEEVLFLGDTVPDHGLFSSRFHSDYVKWQHSLQRVSDIPFQTVLLGHDIPQRRDIFIRSVDHLAPTYFESFPQAA